MTFFLYYAALFCAKVFDNTLSTTKTILIQRNRSLLAGLTVAVSDFIYFMLIKNVLSACLFPFGLPICFFILQAIPPILG